MITVLLVAGCVGVLLVAVIVAAVVMQAGQRDTVSTARQDWIHRRSDKDDHGW